MEEPSIAFSVARAEGEGSDEEEEAEERLRKEELHQLLTEQLQDHLLDDSVSTATTEDGAADSTLLGEEMGVSIDHVISPNQSCDLPLLPAAHADISGFAQSLPELTTPQHSQANPAESAPAIGSGSGPGQGAGSDLFSGTAQAYSLVSSFPDPLSHCTAQPTDTAGHTHQEVMSSPSQGGWGQLEVLYRARCREAEHLAQQLRTVQEEKERQERVQRHEKRLAEERLETERTELQDQVMQLSDKLRETSAAMATIQAEREEVCAMLQLPTHGSDDDVARRLVELSTEKEDLQYQLSCCQGQLETQTQRAETAETEVSRLSGEILSVRAEVERLRSEVAAVESERVREREAAALEKRDALEKCREACLKLHEDASGRLREALISEKETALLEQSHKTSALETELCTVQQEYVRVCGEKEEVEAAHQQRMEEAERVWKARAEELVRKSEETEVKEAVEKARERWQQMLAQEGRQSVEKALSTARQQWQARLTREKEVVRIEMAREREAAVREAVEAAHSQWQQTMVQRDSEPVLSASQVHSLLQATMASVKRDVRQMLEEVVREARERERQAVARCRLATAQQLKSHYLSCLHMMVNYPTSADSIANHSEEGRGQSSAVARDVVGTKKRASGVTRQGKMAAAARKGKLQKQT